jgi:hypothetical protein
MTDGSGLAGRLATAFINSRLTPLLNRGIARSRTLFGHRAATRGRATDRRSDDRRLRADAGRRTRGVEQRIARPLEKLLWEVPGVEYLYSTSSTGQALVIVRFYVGENEEARSCG